MKKFNTVMGYIDEVFSTYYLDTYDPNSFYNPKTHGVHISFEV